MSNHENELLRESIWNNLCEEEDGVMEDLWENEKISGDDILIALRKHAPSIFKGLMLSAWDIAYERQDAKLDKAVQDEFEARLDACPEA